MKQRAVTMYFRLQEVLLSLLAEQMDNIAAKGDVDRRAITEAGLLLGAQIDGGIKNNFNTQSDTPTCR